MKKFILFALIALVTYRAPATLKLTNERNQTIPIHPRLLRISPSSIETFMGFLSALEYVKTNVKPWLYVETIAQLPLSAPLHEVCEIALMYGRIEIAHGLARKYLTAHPEFDGTFAPGDVSSPDIQNLIRTQYYAMTDDKEIMHRYGLTLSLYELVISKKRIILNRKLDLSDCFLNSLFGIEFYKGTPMQQLDVSHNQLTQLPASLAGLRMLNAVVATHNHLTDIADEVCLLPELTKLDVSHNQLATLPENIGALKTLWRLDISHNQLSELPASFSNLSKLHWLSLGNNVWDEVPETVGALPSLTKVKS